MLNKSKAVMGLYRTRPDFENAVDVIQNVFQDTEISALLPYSPSEDSALQIQQCAPFVNFLDPNNLQQGLSAKLVELGMSERMANKYEQFIREGLGMICVRSLDKDRTAEEIAYLRSTGAEEILASYEARCPNELRIYTTRVWA